MHHPYTGPKLLLLTCTWVLGDSSKEDSGLLARIRSFDMASNWISDVGNYNSGGRQMEGEFSVNVSGIGEEYRDTAERDIRLLASIAAGVADKSGLPFLLHEIRLTAQLQEDSNEMYRQRRDETGEYAALRDDVLAYGKTIWSRSADGELAFVVLIDSSIVRPWNLNNPWFLVVVLHELGHVIYETQELKRLGHERYVTSEYTKKWILESMARAIIDEYRVDRFVDWVVKTFCTNDTGNPLSLREIEEDIKEMDWAGSLRSALERMPQRIDDVVCRYKTRQIELHELLARVPSNVKDILVLFSHTCALYLGTDSWSDTIESFTRTEASRRFFGGHMEVIAEALMNNELTIEDTLQVVAQAIENIFRSCGLTFEDTSEGLYAAVNWPTR